MRRALRIAARFKVPVTAVRALVRPEAAHRHAEQLGLQIAELLVVRENVSSAERLDFVARILLNHTVSLIPRIMPAPVVGFAMLGLADKLLGDAAQEGDLQAVLRGLPHNVTTEMDLSLWALANRIRSDTDSAAAFHDGTPDSWAARYRSGTLPSVTQRGLTEFLGRFGHRAVAEIDAGMPRWSDDPRHILGVLANYLRVENDDAAPDVVFARGRREAQAMIETLTSRARQRSRLRARIVRFALGRAQALTGLRELPKYYLIVIIAAVRKQLQFVGAELVAGGRLDQRDDVFFVDLTEARAGLGGRNLRDVVAIRKATYELELRRRHIPRVLLSDGTEPEALAIAAPARDGSLLGTPASAGRATGNARVIIDPVGAHLEPGEILVAPSTDPGWTPLFLTAGGLVMEMGGANSHGAVVAREYGIPAVVGVPDATDRITTGQHITVDGSAGTVTVM